MPSTLLALDIGNTSVTYGVYKGRKLRLFGSKPNHDIPKFVKNLRESGREESISHLILSSVVPKTTEILLKSLRSQFALKLWVAGENIPVRIKHKYRSFKKLGIDRKVNIFGATKMYRLPILILDYGTAVTADYVSRLGVFEGGMIIPGPEIAFQALIARAALLPKRLRLPNKSRSFLGLNTYDCMSSGIFQGYGALTDALVERFRARYGKSLKVLATGGFATHLRPFTRAFDVVDPKHSIRSLYLLFRENVGA